MRPLGPGNRSVSGLESGCLSNRLDPTSIFVPRLTIPGLRLSPDGAGCIACSHGGGKISPPLAFNSPSADLGGRDDSATSSFSFVFFSTRNVSVSCFQLA